MEKQEKSKSEKISAYFTPQEKNALKWLADREGRTMSKELAQLVKTTAIAKGYANPNFWDK